MFASTIVGAGAGATAALATVTSTAARVSLGGAFWTVALVSALAMTEAAAPAQHASRRSAGLRPCRCRDARRPGIRRLFDNLSLAREWANRREAYGAAFGEHLSLVGPSLAFALLMGVPLGIAAAGRPHLSRPIFTVLNLVQTIPSIALFGLLIGPLTALGDALPWLHDIGVTGIGFYPAVIALTLYGLLPIARSTEAGILSVPAAAIETARGVGMTKLQIPRVGFRSPRPAGPARGTARGHRATERPGRGRGADRRRRLRCVRVSRPRPDGDRSRPSRRVCRRSRSPSMPMDWLRLLTQLSLRATAP